MALSVASAQAIADIYAVVTPIVQAFGESIPTCRRLLFIPMKPAHAWERGCIGCTAYQHQAQSCTRCMRDVAARRLQRSTCCCGSRAALHYGWPFYHHVDGTHALCNVHHLFGGHSTI
jgi:hypothetical protein